MRMTKSVYEFACICGQHFEVEDPHHLVCPRCGRSLVVEWRTPPESTVRATSAGAAE